MNSLNDYIPTFKEAEAQDAEYRKNNPFIKPVDNDYIPSFKEAQEYDRKYRESLKADENYIPTFEEAKAQDAEYRKKVKSAFPEPSRARSPEEESYQQFLKDKNVNPETFQAKTHSRIYKAGESLKSGVEQAGAGIAALPGFVRDIDKTLRASAIEKRKELGDPLIDVIPGEYLASLEKRKNGSFKGKGFYGELKRPDGGVSTELSIGTADVEPGKEVEIPTLVPGLSQEQKDYLLNNDPGELSKKDPQMWDSIAGKAIEFAKERKAKNLPYFATNTEQPIDKQSWVDILDGTAKFMKDKAAQKSQVASGGLDITDTFKQKGTAAAVEQVLYGTINQIPNLATQAAAFMLTGGAGSLAYMGVTSAASQYNDVKDNSNMSESGKLANAIGNGAFEVIGEKLGTIPILGKYLGEEGKKAVKKGVFNFLKNIGGDMFREGTSEGFTQLGQNLTDMLTGNTEKPLSEMTVREKAKQLGQGAIDATIIGGAMGGMMGGGGSIMNQAQRKSRLEQLKGLRRNLNAPIVTGSESTDLLNSLDNATSSNELEGVPEQKDMIDFPASGENVNPEFGSMTNQELAAYIISRTGESSVSTASRADLIDRAFDLHEAERQTEAAPAENANINFNEMDRSALVEYIEGKSGESVYPGATQSQLVEEAYNIYDSNQIESAHQAMLEEEKNQAEMDKAREVVQQQKQAAQAQQAIGQEQAAVSEQLSEQEQIRQAKINEAMQAANVQYQLDEAAKIEKMSIKEAQIEISKDPQGKNVDALLAHIDKLNGVIPQAEQAVPEPEQAQEKPNVYMNMPIERVRQDAENGVLLAQEALAQREPPTVAENATVQENLTVQAEPEALQSPVVKKNLTDEPGTTEESSAVETAIPPIVPKKGLKKKEALQKKEAEPRRATTEGRAVDGQPISPGDRFITSSGRTTTPYPKTRKNSVKIENQWLIDNALAEAESRGDEFNARSFAREKADNLPRASVESMNQYLYGEQPKVIPSILKEVKGVSQNKESIPADNPSAQKEEAAKPESTPANKPGLKMTGLKGVESRFNQNKPESERVKLEEVKEGTPAITAAQKLAKALGVEIVVFRNTGAGQGFEGIFLNDGKIYVDADSKSNPVKQVAIHELAHAMQKNTPELWQEFLSELEKISDKGKLADYIAKRRAQVEKALPGSKFSDDYFKMEYGADVMGSLLSGDEKILEGLHKANPGIVSKILDILKNIKAAFEKIIAQKSIVKGKSAMDESIREILGENIDPAIAAAEKFLSGAVEKEITKPKDSTGEDVLFSPAESEGIFSVKSNPQKKMTLEEIAKDKTIKPLDIVLSPEGKEYWGIIPEEVERETNGMVKSLPIVLKKGMHDSRIDRGFGIVHILHDHAEELKKLGWNTAGFLQNIIDNCNSIVVQEKNRSVLFKYGKPDSVMVLELRINDGHYSIVTAFPRVSGVQVRGKEVWRRRAARSTNQDKQLVPPTLLHSDVQRLQSPLEEHAGQTSKAIIDQKDDNVKEDMQFSPKSEAKETNKINEARSWAKEWLSAMREKNKNAKEDISHIDKVVSTIFYYMKKVPAISRMFDAGLQKDTDKHLFGNLIFNKDNGKGEFELNPMVELSKKNKPEYARLRDDHLWKRDIDAIGGTVTTSEDGKTFHARNENNELIGDFLREELAWDAVYQSEITDMRKSGKWSEQAIGSVLAARRVNRNSFQMMRNGVLDNVKKLKKLGAKAPVVEGVDIREYLKQMGDRSGYYMPRTRLGGRQFLWASKEGEHSRFEKFDSTAARAALAATLRRDGYTVEFTQSNTPSEEAFVENDILAMNDLINNAVERMKKKEHLTFEQFGLKGKWIDFPLKSGKTEKHFTISGERSTMQGELLKSFGGRFYEESWHFKNVDDEFEKVILNAIAHNEGATIMQAEAIGQALAEQMATIIHSHGSRSHKIKRDNRKGKDVYLGFEEDPIKAITLAGRSIAGGTAKRIMANSMMEAFTGHDLKWSAYKKDNMPKGLTAGSSEYYKAMAELWKSYEKAVKERAIDSATQPNAYSEAKSFMNDMLRNDERLDRIFGMTKAAMALQFLSGVSSGVINLTSLATSVPAAMHGLGGIPAIEIPKLLTRGMSSYTTYSIQKKRGKASTLSATQKRLFDDITNRGWDTDLQNQDLTESAMTHGGKVFNSILKWSLIVFSTTEKLNRASTIAAAYNGMVAQHKGVMSEVQREEYLMKAKSISDHAHGVYGKINLPGWARGPGIVAHIGKSMYVYKNYMHNYYLLMRELWTTGHRKDVIWMAIAPMVIAGTKANPLQPLLGPILRAIISGLGGPDDPEEALYQWLEEKFGLTSSRFARTGLAGGLFGINLKGSMAAGSFEVPELSDLGGVPQSFFEGLGEGIQEIGKGRYGRGIEKIAPKPIANIFKARREYTEGITSRDGDPVFFGNKQLKSDWQEAALRGLGFNPAYISEKRETQWSEKQVIDKYGDMKKSINTKIHLYFASNNRTQENWDKNILPEIEAFNARVIKRDVPGVSPITSSSIMSLFKNATTPSKIEKERAGLRKRQHAEQNLTNFPFINQ